MYSELKVSFHGSIILMHHFCVLILMHASLIYQQLLSLGADNLHHFILFKSASFYRYTVPYLLSLLGRTPLRTVISRGVRTLETSSTSRTVFAIHSIRSAVLSYEVVF